MKRLVNIQKWNDAWFNKLKPNQKLLFIFLTDNCDDAGFYELNFKLMSDLTGITPVDCKQNFLSLKKSFIVNKRMNKIWLKNFLRHQELLPLDLTNPFEKKVYSIIQNNIEDFDNHKCLKDIVSSALIRYNQTGIIKPNRPKLSEWREYLIEQGYDQDENINYSYDYYEKVGWMVAKNKPILDWKACARNWISQAYKFNGGFGKNKKSIQEVIENGQEYIDKL